MAGQAPQLLLFADGVRAALARWEVLQAALSGSWGGRNTREKGEWLEETIIDMFAKGEVYADDLEITLDDIMTVEFHAEVRDGSLEHVSKLISQMYRDCRAGNTQRLESFIASALPPKPEAPEMDESEAEDGEAEAEEELDPEDAPDLIDSLSLRSPPQPPRGPDEDGWETVTRSRRR